MDIAAELQQEASQRAGSPEGFLQVIHLVIQGIEKGENTPPFSFTYSPLNFARPEWVWPEQYLPIFHQYVGLMQEVLVLKRRSYELDFQRRYKIPVDGFVRDEYAENQKNQKQLSDATHAARRKARELPIHAFKRLKAFETRHASRWGGHGADYIYFPDNWEEMCREMEWFITHWGVGRE